MLQGLRDSLKGTVAVVVIIIFVVPLVLFGVEQLFVGSVGGNDAATVNGEGIHVNDFQRELALEKQRLQVEHGLEPGSPQLDDAVLAEPVLRRMSRQLALIQAGQEGRMGAPEDEVWREIAAIEAFHVDGRFNSDRFVQLISGAYTPATFHEAASKDFLVRQLNSGIADSGFVTSLELDLVAAITQQKRSFTTIELAPESAGEISVSEAEIAQYYEDNAHEFMLPESVKVEYLEVSIDDLAAQIEPDEQAVRDVYQNEIADFSPEPRFSVAHILIEHGEGSAAKVEEVQGKISEGQDFSELAQQYSDDLGSKGVGGQLGELVEDAYPQAFVAAAKSMEAGEITPPVETEQGTHFIKVLDVTNVEPPTLEDRRHSITRQLSRQLAQESYVRIIAQMDELTFGADTLNRAAEALDLEVQTSESFSREGGSGIASSQQVVDSAYGEDVLEQGHNSRVLELPGQRAVVLRVAQHEQPRLVPLADVSEHIHASLTQEKLTHKLAEQAAGVISQLTAGQAYETVAEELGLAFEVHTDVNRNESEVSPPLLRKAFSLPRPGSDDDRIIDSVSLPSGGYAIIALTDVKDGSVNEMSDVELAGIKGQLSRIAAQGEFQSFESGVYERASIDLRY